MNYKQTDSCFNEDINKYGCLFFSLMDIAENFTGNFFTIRMINKLYDHLTTTTFEANGKEFPLMEKDCYINSHTKALQDILEVFGCHDKVTYSGAWYNEFITDRSTWGQKNGMYMILQFKTVNGNGHFRRPRYDSYKPGPVFNNLMSVRYYDIGI